MNDLQINNEDEKKFVYNIKNKSNVSYQKIRYSVNFYSILCFYLNIPIAIAKIISNYIAQEYCLKYYVQSNAYCVCVFFKYLEHMNTNYELDIVYRNIYKHMPSSIQSHTVFLSKHMFKSDIYLLNDVYNSSLTINDVTNEQEKANDLILILNQLDKITKQSL